MALAALYPLRSSFFAFLVYINGAFIGLMSSLAGYYLSHIIGASLSTNAKRRHSTLSCMAARIPSMYGLREKGARRQYLGSSLLNRWQQAAMAGVDM